LFVCFFQRRSKKYHQIVLFRKTILILVLLSLFEKKSFFSIFYSFFSSQKKKMPIHVFVGWDHAVSTQTQDLILDTLKTITTITSVKHFGPRDPSNRVDYPDVAAEVCNAVISSNTQFKATEDCKDIAVGILVCGSGIGMSIAANKMPGIRAALCHDHYTAMMARQHNDANVLCCGARTSGPEIIIQMIQVFFSEQFAGEGTRHAARVSKIHGLESVPKKE
jgi:ribose 5-phosphate isomerase B